MYVCMYVCVCMCMDMSIDYVLGRTEIERRAWRFKCHFPKSLFVNKTGRPGKKRVSNKCYDYPLFKRMVATKEVVYKNHRKMFRLYEHFCEKSELPKYWENREEQEITADVEAAEATNEVIADDEF